MIGDWWRRRKARRDKLAKLEADESVDLETALKKMDEATEKRKTTNGRALDDMEASIEAAEDEAVSILEEALGNT